MLKSLQSWPSLELPALNWHRLALCGVLLLAVTSHAINMLGYPFYDNVEGTNMAGAWAALHDGSLSPYTYNYDYPPMGWILLAGVTAISRLFPAQETILTSGRVLMLGVHVLTVLMVYGVARKLHLRLPFVILAVVVFCLSPLVTILQRRILLENLATLWMLVALYCVIGSRRTLMHYAASALALGMALLTSVAALAFVPAILYVVARNSHESHRRFVLALWLGITVSLALGFPLHAMLKEELFPAGSFLGGTQPHVSLIETQQGRLERVTSREFLRSDSSFGLNLDRWTDLSEAASDPGFLIAGLLSALGVAVITLKQAHLRPLTLLLVFYGLHLATLKRLFDPDIVPMLPLFAICIAYAVQFIAGSIKTRTAENSLSGPYLYALLASLLVVVFGSTYMRKHDVYTVNQVEMQLSAIEWIAQNARPDSVIVTDNFAFVDLRQTIPESHYYWVVEIDPQVRTEVFENNWCKIDYLVTTPQMLQDMEINQLRILLTAHRSSTTLQLYENNGWPIDIREVQKHNCNRPTS